MSAGALDAGAASIRGPNSLFGFTSFFLFGEQQVGRHLTKGLPSSRTLVWSAWREEVRPSNSLPAQMVHIRDGQVVESPGVLARLNPMKLVDLIVLFFQTLISPEPVAVIRARNAAGAANRPAPVRPPRPPAQRYPNVRTLGTNPGGTPGVMPGGG